MSYYKRFGIIIGTPLWRRYIRRQYEQGVIDLLQLGYKPHFERKGFTCLLCGVGNEVTADEYIGFVLRKNPDARIWIIDLGEEQIIAVKKMVKSKYKGEDIIVKQVNALDLEKIVKLVSIDWIETDAVWEFFDYKSLKQLLDVWKKILKADGFVTTSATSYGGWWGRMVDQFKIWIGKKWLKVRVYSHERAKLHKLIRDSDYEFCERSTLMPYFRRYSMILR